MTMRNEIPMKKHLLTALTLTFFIISATVTITVQAEEPGSIETAESIGQAAVTDQTTLEEKQEPAGQWIHDGNGWWYENPDDSVSFYMKAGHERRKKPLMPRASEC